MRTKPGKLRKLHGGRYPVSGPWSGPRSFPGSTPVRTGVPPDQDWSTRHAGLGYPLARTGVPPLRTRYPTWPGQVMPRRVCFLRLPAGGLSCFQSDFIVSVYTLTLRRHRKFKKGIDNVPTKRLKQNWI